MRIFIAIFLGLGSLILAGCQSTSGPGGSIFSQEMFASDGSAVGSVQSALAGSGMFNDVNIQVMSEGNGMITLSGYVKTIKQYDTAVRIASEAPGVRGVRNHLVVRK